MKKKYSYFSFLLFLFLLFLATVSKSQTCSTVPLTILSQYQTTGSPLPMTPVADRLSRPYLYVAAKDGGLLIFDISVITIPVLSQTLDISHFDSLHVMNVYQQGNYLYLALGNFFGNGNTQKPGIAIVNITNPLNPVVTDIWEYPTVEKGSAYVTVDGNYAFLGGMTKGLIILNVSNVNAISYVSEYLPNPNYPLNNPTASQMPNARGLAVSGNKVYVCYDAGGLRVIDITNINAPTQTGQYINVACLGKQQAYNNIILNGNLAYIAVDFCGMEIVDISNTSSITQVGWWNPYNCEGLSNLWLNSPGHMNEIAYLPADNAIFLSAGGSQLRVIDVTNPALPDSCNGYGITNTQEGSWGLDVYQNKIYLANITSFIPFFSTWKGIKILGWASTQGVGEDSVDRGKVTVQPNPFSEETEIQYELNKSNSTTIEITDIIGREITEFGRLKLNSGPQKIKWNGRNAAGEEVAGGMYFVKIKTNNNSSITKLFKISK